MLSDVLHNRLLFEVDIPRWALEATNVEAQLPELERVHVVLQTGRVNNRQSNLPRLKTQRGPLRFHDGLHG